MFAVSADPEHPRKPVSTPLPGRSTPSNYPHDFLKTHMKEDELIITSRKQWQRIHDVEVVKLVEAGVSFAVQKSEGSQHFLHGSLIKARFSCDFFGTKYEGG
jgi:hypothetical protein